MGPSVHVRIAGVLVRCHAATPVALLVMLHGFDHARAAGVTERIAIAILACGVVLLAIALHELAKALIYARHGVRTRRIDLLIAGGATRLVESANRPATDLFAAVAGLATVALISGGAGIARALNLQPAVLDETIRAAAPLLLAIALVQLLPAVPFDGGKLLRATVWAIGEECSKGTKAAALYSQLLSAGFIAGGALLLAAGADWSYWGFGGIVLGGQLLVASLDAIRDDLILKTAGGLSLAQLALPLPSEIEADTAIAGAAARLLGQPNPGRLLIVDAAGAPVGAVTMRDLRRLPRRHWEGRTIADLATPLDQLPVAAPDAPARETLLRLERSHGIALAIGGAGDTPVTLVEEPALRAALLARALNRTDDEVPVTPTPRR